MKRSAFECLEIQERILENLTWLLGQSEQVLRQRS